MFFRVHPTDPQEVVGLPEGAVMLSEGLSGKPGGQDLGGVEGSCVPERESGTVSKVPKGPAVTWLWGITLEYLGAS